MTCPPESTNEYIFFKRIQLNVDLDYDLKENARNIYAICAVLSFRVFITRPPIFFRLKQPRGEMKYSVLTVLILAV